MVRRIAAAALVAVVLASAVAFRPPVASAAAAGEALTAAGSLAAVAAYGQWAGNLAMMLAANSGNVAAAQGSLSFADALAPASAAVDAYAAAAGTTSAAVLADISASAVVIGGTKIVIAAAGAQLIYNILTAYADSIGLNTGSTTSYNYSTSYYVLSDSGHRIKWYDNFAGNHIASQLKDLAAGYAYPLNSVSGSLSSASVPYNDSVTIGYSVNGSNRLTRTVNFGALSSEYSGGQYLSMRGNINGNTGNVVSKSVNTNDFRPYYSVALTGSFSGISTVVGMYLIYIDNVSSPSVQGGIYNTTVIPYNSSYTSGITWDNLYGYDLRLTSAARDSSVDVSAANSEGIEIALAPDDIAETLASGVNADGAEYVPPVSVAGSGSADVDWDPEFSGISDGDVSGEDYDLPEDYPELPTGWQTPDFLAPWVEFVVPLISIFSVFAELVKAVLTVMIPSTAGYFLLSAALILSMIFGVLKRLLGG